MRQPYSSNKTARLKFGLRVGFILVIAACLFLSQRGIAVAEQAVSEEAHRYFTRGLAAVEMARSISDFEAAAREMENAKRAAPQWPDVYYNLGLIYEKTGNYQAAIDNMHAYLEIAPGAADAAQVREAIYRWQYLQERNDVGGIWKTDVSASQVSCSPTTYLVTGDTILFSGFLIDDLQLEITNGPDGNRGRILSSKFRYGHLLKDAPFAPVRREGEAVMIDKAFMYTCAANVQPSLCPWEATFTLRQIAENILEGELSAGGFGRNMDLRTTRKQDGYHQCSGRIVLKRVDR